MDFLGGMEMAANSAKSKNHRTLVDNKVLQEEAELSAEEDHVISNLSSQEVETLVGIRKKLDDKAAERATASAFEPSSNIIV
jgi:hypothetical protein